MGQHSSTGTIRLGVIGAGRIGRLHIQTLCQQVLGAKVVCVADSNWEETRGWAEQFGITNVVADPADIWRDSSIDAVIICSPTDTHARYMVEAANAGKAIFCEKPIANTLPATKAALAAVSQAAVPLQLGFNRRFDHNFARIRQLVADNTLGDVHLVNISSRDPAPPPIEYVRVSGGIFADMAIHDFDLARYLVGEDVVKVYASGEVLIDPAFAAADDYDTAVTLLTFANGALCTIDNSRQAVYGYDQRVEVFGARGNASAGNDYPNTVTWHTAEAVKRDKPLYFFLERYKGSFVKEMQTFIDCLVKGTPPPVSGEDGLKALAIAAAAAKSAREERPVMMEEIDNL